MSKYTTELRFIVEQGLTSRMVDNIEANWPLIYSDIGLNDYPIFDEGYRETLNGKIIRHYYTREIGAETVGRWRMFVRDAMFLIMPYYNQLYESEVIAKNMEPLGDRNIQRIEKASGTSSTDSTSTSDTTDVFQDTPQNEMIPAQIKNLQYATNVTIDSGTGTGHADGTYENSVTHNETGYIRPQSELLRLYRDTFLNIDNDVVHDLELAQCFMTIW